MSLILVPSVSNAMWHMSMLGVVPFCWCLKHLLVDSC